MPWGLLLKAGPWAALGVAALVIWGLWGRLEAAETRLAAANAVIAQKESDARLSADIVAKQADALAKLETKVVTQIERIYAAPITRECAASPSMRAASDGVRAIIAPAGGADPGRLATSPVR